MNRKFTFVIERDGKWFVGSCKEVAGANGQGQTLNSCTQNLIRAIKLIVEEKREVMGTN